MNFTLGSGASIPNGLAVGSAPWMNRVPHKILLKAGEGQ